MNSTVGSGVTYNSATGTGSGSVYSFISNFSDNYTNLSADYNNNLITTIDSASNTSSGMDGYVLNGVYWIKSGTVFNTGTVNYYKYSTPKTLGWGLTNSKDGTYDTHVAGNFSVPSSNGSSSKFATTTDNTATKITYTNAGYNTTAYTAKGTYYSEEWSHWYPSVKTKPTSASDVYLELKTGNFNSVTGDSYSRHAGKIVMKMCGSATGHGKNITYTAVSKTKYHYNNSYTGTDGDHYYPDSSYAYTTNAKLPKMTKYRDFVFAGNTTATKSCNTRTYNYSSASNCKKYNQYTLKNVSYNIAYRPHIKVKIVN